METKGTIEHGPDMGALACHSNRNYVCRKKLPEPALRKSHLSEVTV